MFQQYQQPPISDYAVIGDCHTAALVSRTGSIDWLCLPDFHSPAFFSAILDAEKGGRFSVSCDNAQNVTRRYVGDTALLETTFQSADGTLRLTDCMTMQLHGRRNPELQPLREVLRRVEVLEGEPVISAMIAPRPDFGRDKAGFEHRGKLGWALRHHNTLLNLLTDFPLTAGENMLTGRLKAKKGDVYWFSLTFEVQTAAVHAPLGEIADKRIAMTQLWWEYWASGCTYVGDYTDIVRRSALTLRLLTYPLSGALVAAATTSLPEKEGGDYNWDYRFCWLRDAALAICAFLDIGLNRESDAFFGWLGLASGLSAPYLHVLYDIYGRRSFAEENLNALDGYHGAKPVRIGNGASLQLQHDVYGEVMLAVSESLLRQPLPQRLPMDADTLEGFAKAICRQWREPDNGIWELPDKRRHYTYSKVMAWYVHDRLISMHRQGLLEIPLERHLAEREELRQAIEQRGFNRKRNCYVSVFDGDEVDASLLMLPRCGYIGHGDPRMLGTWEAIQRDLDKDGFIFRFPKDTAIGLHGEGAFIICSFWAVEYLAGLGRRDEARRRLDKIISRANDLGLYAEAFDPATERQMGNFPQAFSHTGLINAVMAVEKCKQREAA